MTRTYSATIKLETIRKLMVLEREEVKLVEWTLLLEAERVDDPLLF